MTENDKLEAFKLKLQHLKEEERWILKILKDVRKQLKKYEVEELQTCSESMIQKEEPESDSDGSICGDKRLLWEILDKTELVNNSSLNLELNKAFEDDSNNESEETDDSDYTQV